MSGNKKLPAAIKARHPLLVLEDALVLCEFGRFHYKLMLATLVSTFAGTMVTLTSSFLLPNAQCDLKMSIIQKGLLNAAPFIGFVLTTLFCCVFVDAFGRKKFLVGGHASVFVFTLLEASSQNYWTLLFMKVLEGASLILCLIAMITIVVEFTKKSLRNRIGMFIVSFTPLAVIGGTLISWGLLPHQNWHFVIWKGYIELHAWNIYLYVCSVFGLFATILYCTIPESPKYLLLQGKEVQALEILKNIYSENTGNDRDSFPIKTLGSLRVLIPIRITLKTWVNIYWNKVKQLFKTPVVYQIILFSWFSFASHMVISTIRLWYPQISTIVEYYRKDYGHTDRFCTMINNYTNNFSMDMNNSDVCEPTPSGPETYINNILVAIISFLATNVTGYLVDYLGQKLLTCLLFVLCAASLGFLYFSATSYQIALLVAAVCGFLQAVLGLQKTVLATVFPASLNAIGLSIIIMWSRLGALLGTILFPVLLQIDCTVPYLLFAVILLGTSALVYFIKDEKKTLLTDM